MRSVILICTIAACTTLSAQVTLQGRITDAENQKPLAGVSVYLPELNSGVSSDSSGHYMLTGLHQGSFLVQYTLIGYKSVFRTVTLLPSGMTLDISMEVSAIEMQEVKIIGNHASAPEETSFNVSEMTLADTRQNGALTLCDALAKLPGISQLSTGPGIAKPVIRGMYGNRIQVNLMGIRFDNQQWQDEHGLGLSTIGTDRVEVIRGPATLLYGSEALGGVINIIEEKPAPLHTSQQEINTTLFSNTYGASLDYGIKHSGDHAWWRFRAGAESHGDYSDGNGKRILNSRFADYLAKGSAGFRKQNWVNTENAYLSFSQYGFIFDALSTIPEDGRFSRSMEGPHHQVLFGILTTENTFYKDKGKIQFNAGIHSNRRQEQEGGSTISLDMLLNTYSATLQATRYLRHEGSFSYGADFLFQSNKNLGPRTIVPDALIGEGAAFVYWKQPAGIAVYEAGLRYSRRQIKTFETGNINSPGQEVQPFDKGFNACNGSAGVSLNPAEKLNIKANISSGFRSGNLAELSSDGLHEGTLRWEIGDPDLKTEQNLNAELGLDYLGRAVDFHISGYVNRFFDYIYLAPTDAYYLGFRIYRFEQTNALLRGLESTFDLHPVHLSLIDLQLGYSFIYATKEDGSFLPFIPANHLQGNLRISLKCRGSFRIEYVEAGSDHVFAQDHPAEFETPTDAYTLVHVGFGGTWHVAKQEIGFSVRGNNLLDAVYYDHLSRYKDYGIYNMGRDITLSMHIPF